MTTNSAKSPIFSVIVPTVGRELNLECLLNSLEDQSLKSFETILVFRELTDSIISKYSRKYKTLNLICIKQEHNGLVSARNTGLKIARGEFVVFTDDDVEPSKKWLGELYKTFKSDSTVVGATGPSLIPEQFLKNRDLTKFADLLSSGNLLWKALGKVYFWYFYENKPFTIGRWFQSGAFSLGANYTDRIKTKKDFEVMDLQACNFAVRRAAALNTGGFDSSFKALASYSESDFAFRLRAGKQKLMFNPKAVILHKPSQGGVFSERIKSKTEIENYLLFYFRHIKIKNIDNLFRFLLYFFIIASYRGVYQSIISRSIEPLMGVMSGTIFGLGRFLVDTKAQTPTEFNIFKTRESLSRYFHHPSVVLWRTLELTAILENIPKINKPHPMLDLGCGEGKIAEIVFGKKNIDVGLDPVKSMVTKARKFGVYNRVVQGDARDMPFDSNSFNFVFSNSVIEHIDGIDKVVSEVSRVLSHGGEFLFTVPNEKLRRNLFITAILNKIGLVRLAKMYSNAINNQLDHYNLLSIKNWQKLLSKNKLKITYSANYLNKKQTYVWDIYRLIFYVLKPLEKNKILINIQNMLSYELLKKIKLWECDMRDGSCTIIIAKKTK